MSRSAAGSVPKTPSADRATAPRMPPDPRYPSTVST